MIRTDHTGSFASLSLFRSGRVSWFILAVGLLITAAATLSMKSNVEKSAENDFIVHCGEIQHELTARLYDHARILRSSAAYIYASETVTRKSWHTYTRLHKIEQQLPGIQGIGFSLVIPRPELSRHIKSVRREGYPEYTVKPDGDRAVYSSIVYIEPFSGRNLRSFGYDMLTEPVRRAAMEQARDTDSAVLSGKVVLIQELDRVRQAGTLMYVPVYRKGAVITTMEQRRAALFGWVFSPYRMNNLMQGIFEGRTLENEKQLHLQIFDGTQTSPEHLLYQCHPDGDRTPRQDIRFSRLMPVNFNGHPWMLSFTQSGGGLLTAEYAKMWLVVGGGTLITLLLFGLIGSLLNTRTEARLMAEKLTADLSDSTEELVAQNIELQVSAETLNEQIAEYEAVQVQLQEATLDAETANTAKSRFLANMSHEIRTPLNGIIGMTQLLEMTELTEEQRELFLTLKLSGKNLLTLINDILDLSKIEAGKVVLESVEFSLLHSINDIVMMQKYVMYEKGLHLVVAVAEDMPSVLKGDQLRIKQILHNLLGNAVKFTAQGTVTVSASIVEQHDCGVLVKIAVRDTGIGLSDEALETVFKPFIQEHGSTTKTYGGTGLGLTISRCLAELMGGSITVESAPGIGSTFTVTLPLTIAADADMAVEPEGYAAVRLNGPSLRVLLVEDDPINIIYEEALLNKTGHDVTVVLNGRECLAVLAQHPFDLVLMDIQMPLMNGEEALCEIRRKESGTSLHQKIIALTAYSMRGEQTRFLEEGFDGYVSKPLIIKELMDEMKRVMEKNFPVECGSNVKPGGFL